MPRTTPASNVASDSKASRRGRGIARPVAAWPVIERGRRLWPSKPTLAQWGRVGKIASVKRLYQPLTMNKGMCNTTTAGTVAAIALATLTCYTCGILCLQLDRVNRLSSAKTIQPDQSFKSSAEQRLSSVRKRIRWQSLFSFPVRYGNNTSEPTQGA